MSDYMELVKRLKDKTRLRKNHGLTGWVLAQESLDVEAADAIESLERRLREAEEWNRKMVEKAASGGVLDGYRELGAKCAALEERAERAEDERDALKAHAEEMAWVLGNDHSVTQLYRRYFPKE
jgi:hypothetical protein